MFNIVLTMSSDSNNVAESFLSNAQAGNFSARFVSSPALCLASYRFCI